MVIAYKIIVRTSDTNQYTQSFTTPEDRDAAMRGINTALDDGKKFTIKEDINPGAVLGSTPQFMPSQVCAVICQDVKISD